MMAEPLYSDTGCTGSTPLVLGTARGMRTFYIDENGWMRGVTYRYPWRPGENIARCFVARPKHAMVHTTRASLAYRSAPYVMGGVVFYEDPDTEPTPEEGHEFVPCTGLETNCGCGFYAYHNSQSLYATSGPGCRVTGVVEAYGRMVLGTSGFRAEKARILGVVVPPGTEAGKNRRIMERTLGDIKDAATEIRARVRRPWWRQRNVAVYAGLAAACAAWCAWATSPGGLLVAGYLGACARITYKVDKARAEAALEMLHEEMDQAAKAIAALPDDYAVHIERARRNYPDVQFFESLDELKAAYPVESLAALARAHKKEEVEDNG